MEHVSNILILPGSLRKPSYTHSLAHAIRAAITARGVPSSIWDLRERPLPFADPQYHHEPESHPDDAVKSFVKNVAESDALVLVTPIYHNGLSGVLKNAIDLLAIPHLFMKPVGLASHGGARTTQAVEQLRIIVRGLSASATVSQVCTSNTDFGEPRFDGYHHIANERIAERIDWFCNELIIMASLMPTARKLLRN